MESAQKASRLPEASRRPKVPISPHSEKNQSGSREIQHYNASVGSVKNSSDTIKNKEKSVSLAVQAKVNVQSREGLTSRGNKSSINRKEGDEVRMGKYNKSQINMQKSVKKRTSTARTSDALKQNNQKQNCVANTERAASKAPVSNQQDRKAPSSNDSVRPNKASNKLTVKAAWMLFRLHSTSPIKSSAPGSQSSGQVVEKNPRFCVDSLQGFCVHSQCDKHCIKGSSQIAFNFICIKIKSNHPHDIHCASVDDLLLKAKQKWQWAIFPSQLSLLSHPPPHPTPPHCLSCAALPPPCPYSADLLVLPPLLRLSSSFTQCHCSPPPSPAAIALLIFWCRCPPPSPPQCQPSATYLHVQIVPIYLPILSVRIIPKCVN
ncbi:hypothetical protein Acr_19g0001460 [Actinidia rufa]|uniref:Uncharacterized protein n=1 Tax=Actinidia rufa TaxID=165716 RepID=A0A7J0G8V0_9ERIC|nr:hypothetical protein Acr_19g0001460 [Actinidia rufa]